MLRGGWKNTEADESGHRNSEDVERIQRSNDPGIDVVGHAKAISTKHGSAVELFSHAHNLIDGFGGKKVDLPSAEWCKFLPIPA